jgi:hypothetical protein
LPPRFATPTPIPCYLPDLAFDQHLSASGSYTETQWTASGKMICRVERDTCAYYQMVGILDPTIVFKREENPPFHAEDIVMHPAMLAPLSRLSKMVLAEWDGAFHLRVTDAYDSLLEHDLNQLDESRKYSLHFEGRAIDLTLWPVDRSRYGRLCALAHCAGFDWVHNEGDHCHASIKAKSLCEQCSD